MKNSLNDIRLTPQMLADLYGQSLVAPVDHTQVKKAAPKPRVGPKYLGGNAKKVTVLVDNSGVAFLPENELAFLTKMLEACRLNIGDVAIVNLATQVTTMPDLLATMETEKLLSFGIDSLAPKFVLSEEAGKPAVHAPALKLLAAETADARALKTKLWGALKQLFGL